MRLLPALVVVLLLLPSGGRAEEASNVDLLKAFAGVAFGSEYEKRKPRILKWEAPVNAAVIGKGYPPLFEKLVLAQLDDLARETGHPVRLVYSEVMRQEKRLPPDVSKIPINLLIFFAPKKDLPALIEKQTNGAFKAPDVQKFADLGYCHGRMQIHKSGALKFAYVAVPAEIVSQVQYGTVRVDPAIFTRACVVEEITQLMGLINDVPGLKFSIFSDDSAHVDLTAEDRWMLRMLYDPRMKAGMEPREALTTAAAFLKEKRREVPQGPTSPQLEPRQKSPRLVSGGTGFVIDPDGKILTNHHVVSNCQLLLVEFPGVGRWKGQLVAYDEINDLAVVSFSKKQNPYLKFRADGPARLGERVLTFGFPFRGELSVNGVLTDGTVNAVAGFGDDTRYLQISAPIQPGNSGGALVSQDGLVAGIVTARLPFSARGEIAQNVNFAIKSETIRQFLDAQRLKYEVSRKEGAYTPEQLAERIRAATVFVGCFM